MIITKFKHEVAPHAVVTRDDDLAYRLNEFGFDFLPGEHDKVVDLFPKGATNKVAASIVKPERERIVATPYVWCDPEKIPPRDFLYDRHLIRKFISATIAAGGAGKSTLLTAQILACVTGKPLLGVQPRCQLRAWMWNLEDPYEEIQRKIQACNKHYGITRDDLGDRLLVDTGRKQQLVIATTSRDGSAVIVEPVVEDLIEQIVSRKIDILVVDPFVSCHRVTENSNDHMDLVAKDGARWLISATAPSSWCTMSARATG
jgi:hypothetical protein